MVNGMAAAPCAAVISVNSCYKYHIWEGPYKLMTNFRGLVIDYKNMESETRYIISNLEISCGRQKGFNRKTTSWKCMHFMASHQHICFLWSISQYMILVSGTVEYQISSEDHLHIVQNRYSSHCLLLEFSYMYLFCSNPLVLCYNVLMVW